MENYKNLIPTTQPMDAENRPLLEDHTLVNDITFSQWFKYFLENLGRNHWSWTNAKTDNVKGYAWRTLLGFCSDSEKIKLTQNMVKAFIANPELGEFVLTQLSSYEEWASEYGDSNFDILMIEKYVALVAVLHERFQALKGDSRIALEPFITYLKNLHESKEIADVKEFINLFNGPLEFHAYITSCDKFDDPEKELHKYNKYPSDSRERMEVLENNIYWHMPVCYAVQNGQKIAIEDKDYLQNWKNKWHQLTNLSVSTVAKLLGVTIYEFYEKVIPTTNEPLKVVLHVGVEKGIYKVSLDVEETDDYFVLRKHDDHRSPARLLRGDRFSKDWDTPKLKRNKLQQKLIDCKGKQFDAESIKSYKKPIHRAKETYFRNFFLECQKHTGKFGRFLTEIRYLAYVASEIRFVTLRTPMVFPKVLEVEDNVINIINASNPTLLYSPEEKGRTVISNDILINEKYRVQIITGPNQNGKSRYMDSIGLLQIMFQAGLPIFAKDASMSPKTDLRVHYVHSGVGITGESRFSHECQRMNSVFAEMNGAYPLVLVDEPYTGTNPGDAESLLKEMIQACSEEGISLMLTTHFHGLIDFITTLPNGRNLHCVVNSNKGFTYQIQPGSSRISNALLVAEHAGVRLDQLKKTIQERKNYVPQEATASDGDDLPF